MGLDQEVCAACRRPRDEREIEKGRESIRRRAETRRRRPLVIARWAVLAAVLILAFRLRGFFFAQTSGLRNEYAREKEKIENPGGPPVFTAPPTAATALPGTPPAQTASAPPPAAVSAPARGPAPKDDRQPERVADLLPPAFNPAAQWAFYGRVYDLIALRPVADVKLSFSIAGNDAWSPVAKTDAYGRFCIVLPRLTEGSFEIHAVHPDYESPVLYEPDIPYAGLPLAKRRDIVRAAQDGDMPLPALTDVVGEASVRRDVFLAPRR